MEERILQFISSLRSSGVRVSLAETEDAFKAVDQLGIQDRETFRLTLRATLVKDVRNLPSFDELFPLFFDTSNAPPMMNIEQDMTPEEADMLAQALQNFNETLREMLERLIRGEQFTQEELDQIGQLTGVRHADDLRYREWMARRMQQALGFQKVRQALEDMLQLLAQLGMDPQRTEQMRGILQANQRSLEEQLRQYAGQQIAENMSVQRPDNDIENLLNRPFGALSDKDMDKLRKEVQRLATILRSRVALRQKRAKSGQLDAKATIRANLKHGSVPFHIKHRSRRLKPKLVVICDISTSMRHCSELMLSLLHAMQDQVSKTHAFAFIDHLEFISPDFMGKQAKEAVSSVMQRMPSGYYSTDLGNSLGNFDQDYMDTIDSRTTFIMVGDGRNNYNNPRLDIFRTIARRSNRTLWLNPEPRGQWGTGDSDMLQYEPLCDEVLKVGTLRELTAAVDQLLS